MHKKYLTRALVGLAAGTALAFAAPGSAIAQDVITSVTPGTVPAGGSVHVVSSLCSSGDATLSDPRQNGLVLASTPLRGDATQSVAEAHLTVPASTTPGSYTVSVVCDAGDGSRTITVTPKGAIAGGTGLSDGAEGALVAAGAGALAAAAGGGLLLMRRRRDAEI